MDEKFLRRLQLRDEAAFTAFIRDHQSMVYATAFRMCGDMQEAQDLTQEVFITAFKKIDAFRAECSLSTWLYRIAVNTCLNAVRAQKAKKRLAPPTSGDGAAARAGADPRLLPERVPAPDEVLDGMRLERSIQEALASLDEEQRLLLVLRDMQQISYDEIAAILSVPVGTVKSRLHRARMALKEKLAALRGEGP